jgi:hypothetical protein
VLERVAGAGGLYVDAFWTLRTESSWAGRKVQVPEGSAGLDNPASMTKLEDHRFEVALSLARINHQDASRIGVASGSASFRFPARLSTPTPTPEFLNRSKFGSFLDIGLPPDTRELYSLRREHNPPGRHGEAPSQEFPPAESRSLAQSIEATRAHARMAARNR